MCGLSTVGFYRGRAIGAFDAETHTANLLFNYFTAKTASTSTNNLTTAFSLSHPFCPVDQLFILALFDIPDSPALCICSVTGKRVEQSAVVHRFRIIMGSISLFNIRYRALCIFIFFLATTANKNHKKWLCIAAATNFLLHMLGIFFGAQKACSYIGLSLHNE